MRRVSTLLVVVVMACGSSTAETAPATTPTTLQPSSVEPTSTQEPFSEPIGSFDDPDMDGVTGDADACPSDPEDMDSFQDADGCPDPDNDGDGVLDVNER